MKFTAGVLSAIVAVLGSNGVQSLTIPGSHQLVERGTDPLQNNLNDVGNSISKQLTNTAKASQDALDKAKENLVQPNKALSSGITQFVSEAQKAQRSALAKTGNPSYEDALGGIDKGEAKSIDSMLKDGENRTVDITHGFAQDTVDGRKLIRSNVKLTQENVLSPQEILPKLSFYTLENDAKMKAGNISEIRFTQQDVDLLARAGLTPASVMYESVPVGVKSPEDLPYMLRSQVTNRFNISTYSVRDYMLEKNGTVPETYDFHKMDISNPRMDISAGTDHPFILPSSLIEPFLTLPPIIDPFYIPPSVLFQNVARGAALQYRLITYQVFSVPFLTVAAQVNFKTENADGNTVEPGITTFYIPQGSNPTTMVSYLKHVDAVNYFCRQSYTLALGLPDNLLNEFLSEGYMVNVPDTLGLIGSAFASRKGAKVALDSMSAVHDVINTYFLHYVDNHFIYGYGSAALVAAHMLDIGTQYSPTVATGGQGQIAGAFLGGLIVELNQWMHDINRGVWSSHINIALYGLGIEYPEVFAYIEQHFSGFFTWILGWSSFLNCELLTMLLNQGNDVLGWWSTTLLRQNPLKQRLAQNSFPFRDPLNVPVLVYQSTHDEYARVAHVDRAVDFYCQHGLDVAYERDWSSKNSHGAEEEAVFGHVRAYFRQLSSGWVPGKCAGWQDAQTRQVAPYVHKGNGPSDPEGPLGG